MARISYADPNGVLREVVLGNRLKLGRHPSQDVQILDRVVSKEHAVIELRDGKYILRDNGSRNGTSLNGTTVQAPTTLQDGDEVTIAGTRITFNDDARPDSLAGRVTILEEGFQSAIRSRLKGQDGGSEIHFPKVDLVDDMDQLKRDYEKLRVANELNQAVALEFDPVRLLNTILEKAIEMFGADRGVIMLNNPETGELEPAAMKVKYEEVAGGKAVRISKTIIREVMEEKTAILSSDATMDSRFSGAHSIILAGIKATMSVPLMYEETCHGIIHLDSQLAAGAFTEKDLSLLTQYASQAAKAIEHSRLVEKQRLELVAREQLGRLLSADVVDQIIAGKHVIERGGDLRRATVLFADIRGFTAMSERIPPQEIVTMLNEYFEIMVEIIFKHEGSLDKFVGDEIMAVWGAPIASEDHMVRAVAAALEMQEALLEFNLTRAQEGQAEIYAGIGVNSGDMVAGYMGSSRAMDYTVIGDVVNTGARLCSAAKGGEVVVSDPIISEIGDSLLYESLPNQDLKGKSAVVNLYRVDGHRVDGHRS